MQFKFFVIPIKSLDDAVEEMNRFLRGHRVLAVEKRLLEGGDGQQGQRCKKSLLAVIASIAKQSHARK